MFPRLHSLRVILVDDMSESALASRQQYAFVLLEPTLNLRSIRTQRFCWK